MFPFITKTWSPIAGGFSIEKDKIYACPYRCQYCWANLLINKFPKGNLGKKYTGSYRIHKPAMDPWFKTDDFVFVQCMSDIGAPGIPQAVIIDVFEAIKFYEAKGTRFLLLTKNPKFYRDWCEHIPEETILGATIETDQPISFDISLAPEPYRRILKMEWCADNLPNDRFICVEPIMKMSPDFERDIMKTRPKFMAVGYDNYNNKLPEPSLERTEILIKEFEAQGVKVFRKTLRDPLPSMQSQLSENRRGSQSDLPSVPKRRGGERN